VLLEISFGTDRRVEVLRVDDRGHVRVHHVVVPVGEELVGILGHAVEGHAQALVAPQPLDLLVVDVPVTPESLEGRSALRRRTC
jgi:hypothetical protein